jgi:CheY-like chemotaxis protein
MAQIALIVDDSRTALVSLGRMLGAHGLRAEHAESGPEALDYLKHNAPPDVIFLDHMMPGMDGFETLAALKGDARTAAIPVVMYTSREGEAYIGQALAKGAIGILRKPVDPTELVNVLTVLERARVRARAASRIAPPVPPPRPRAAVTGVIDVPAELRRASVPRPTAEPTPIPVSTTPPASRSVVWVTALALALLAATGWFYQRAQSSETQRAQLQQQLVELQAAQAATVSTPQPVSVETVARPQFLETLGWALNQHNQYGWNEEPLGDARLNHAQELVTRLTAAGFRGSVRLESHLGEFCLARDEQGQLRLPEDTMPFTRCEVVTYPPAQAALQSGRQSAAFARFVAQTTGPVRVVVAPQGASKPLVNYPASASVQTAGEWNAVARLNQRVEIVLVPAP